MALRSEKQTHHYLSKNVGAAFTVHNKLIPSVVSLSNMINQVNLAIVNSNFSNRLFFFLKSSLPPIKTHWLEQINMENKGSQKNVLHM